MKEESGLDQSMKEHRVGQNLIRIRMTELEIRKEEQEGRNQSVKAGEEKRKIKGRGSERGGGWGGEKVRREKNLPLLNVVAKYFLNISAGC